ncbi:LADA_0A04610g1_1 [Lachancea dasiensis]|uniref:LADA_0A04610g1_1 n=1 Tax=Lachancea dasiensis TaxID=1072105 RepID=A0A1G4IP48_9SACH|nr:LADA_0A04610g1_1 [Lachancea dasiensis]
MKHTHIVRNVSKSSLSTSLRKNLIAQCLNLEFDSLLETVRKLPVDRLDENFLQLYLAMGVQHAHVPSVDYLWYKYVMTRKVLMVKPSTLCGIGVVSLNGNKPFIPRQLCAHFEQFYGHDGHKWAECRDELLRIKVESFAKTAGARMSFREKWKVFLEDIDNVVDPSLNICVYDFPHLTASLKGADPELLEQLLFHENKIAIKNSSTLPTLLNMILLQDWLSADFKLRIFGAFRDCHRSLGYSDSISIIFRVLRGDLYRSTKFMSYLTSNQMTLPPLGARCFLATTKGERDIPCGGRV